MSTARLLVSSRQLVVKFWGGQKFTWIFDHVRGREEGCRCRYLQCCLRVNCIRKTPGGQSRANMVTSACCQGPWLFLSAQAFFTCGFCPACHLCYNNDWFAPTQIFFIPDRKKKMGKRQNIGQLSWPLLKEIYRLATQQFYLYPLARLCCVEV